MSFAPLYLLNRLFFRISDFFHHWYIDGSRAILHRCTSVFESLDQTFALRITLRYFWKPLYGDYSIVGRIFGVIFRSGRILIGSVIYLALGAIMLAFYLLWLILPFAILFGAYRAYLTTGP
ncbi:MAG: hypothetical protein A2855_00670 [Candidatus Liptonbacteria bacterium RIFCSPHIGHO2_01_FULL_57_28]|uniref:Uncharacterized protein n=1 Tax=Candidatus Liptonbacteria bacterium RIFCSPHIGHO2_01_FULL_57_28 TaxID=1798647 RepID=A0A1G2CC77_9BACT|nr:MAG: hypothetical protein A2855_00670 [Candidatus Liptonbacteria bacterium RIFCSPHIGHO2_01_FULL_57_28]